MFYDDNYYNRLDAAIDELLNILEGIDGDYDIHNMIDTVSCRFDVQKTDLLDWYDTQY